MKKQLTIAFLSVTLIGNISNAQTKKPNLIIIHTDEHSFRTLGCYRDLMPKEQAFVWGPDAKVETPNIDKIADEGVICTSYYASSPVCTPSRASLMTGLYPQATGAPKNGLHLNEDVPTFAKLLRDQGYATSYVGKWHLAGNGNYTFNIKDNGGFDDNRYMMTGGHAPYFNIANGGFVPVQGAKLNSLLDSEKKNLVYGTDFFTDKALEILERDKSKPFCLMVSFPNPHTPDVARPPYDKMFADMPAEMPQTMKDAKAGGLPAWAQDENNSADEKGGFNVEALRNYFGMVKCIDDNVGRILKFLESNNLSDNTIIVFTSDHGDMYYEHNRVNKGVPYEASARIPFVLRYPNKIKAGKVINTAYTNIDFTPTILGIMGITAKNKFHGLNASADFLNQEKVIGTDRITYYAKSGGEWVTAVNDRYKLIIDKKEKPWLIDLKADPDELINFFTHSKYKVTVKKMQTELKKQMILYGEPGLKSNRPYIY